MGVGNFARAMLVSTGLILAVPPAIGAGERVETEAESLSFEVPAGWSAIREAQAIRLRAAEEGVGMFVMHGFLPYDPDAFIERVKRTPGNRVIRIDSLRAAGKDGKALVWSSRPGTRGGSGTVVDVLLPSHRPDRSNVWIRLTVPREVGDLKRRQYEADLRSVLDTLRLAP